MPTPVDRCPVQPRRRKLLAIFAGAAILPLAAQRGWAQALVPSSLVSWPLGTTRPTGIHDLAAKAPVIISHKDIRIIPVRVTTRSAPSRTASGSLLGTARISPEGATPM